MRIERQATGLADLSALTCDFEILTVHDFEDLPQTRILRAAFAGRFRPGAAGTDDGGVMLAHLRAGLTAWQPQALLIDLTRLDYDYGEGLIDPLIINRSGLWLERSLPVIALHSVLCRSGLEALVDEHGFETGELLAATEGKAIAKLMKRLRRAARRQSPGPTGNSPIT